MKRAAAAQRATTPQHDAHHAATSSNNAAPNASVDPYDHIPPPTHPGHKDKEWRWHPRNAGATLIDLQRQAMYDNPWLRSGYRPLGFNSYVECLISLFYPHNDLLNVYTHLAGAIYFVYEGFTAFSRLGTKGANMDDRLVFFTYAMLVALCFFMSATYHLMRSHSLKVFRKLLTLDIAGIALCIAAADLLVAHFEMRCMLSMRPIYTTAVFVLLGASLFYVPYLVRHRRTNQRTIILAIFSCIAIGSLLHRLSMSGGMYAVDQGTTLRCLFGLLATYGWMFFGLVIRRLKIPERIVVYWFDILGASHQLFHMCSIMGCAHLWRVYLALYEEGAIRYCHHTLGL